MRCGVSLEPLLPGQYRVWDDVECACHIYNADHDKQLDRAEFDGEDVEDGRLRVGGERGARVDGLVVYAVEYDAGGVSGVV